MLSIPSKHGDESMDVFGKRDAAGASRNSGASAGADSGRKPR